MIRAIGITIALIISWTFMSGQSAADLSISEAINLALESNYGITISTSELEIAQINNDWGEAGRYPTIGFTAASTNSLELSDQSSTNRLAAGIGLDWIVFDGFRVQINKSKLDHTEQLSTGKLAVMVENTIEDIILAYYAVLLEQERLNVLQSVMELSQDRYDYIQRKKELGSSLTYEVLQAENIFLSDKAAFYEQEMQVRNAKRNFNFIIAKSPSESWNFTEAFEADTTRYILSDLNEKMVESNQALKNQYTNLVLRQDETQLRQSAFYPTISTSLGMDNSYTRMNNQATGAQTANSFSPYANLRLTYDIYQGGMRKRALEIARINEEIAGIGIEQMEHALTNELFSLYDYHEVRIALLQLAEQSEKTAALNLKISEEKYRTGVINSFNFRDVQLIYLDASLRRIQSIYNLIDSNTKLTRITGGFIGFQE